MPICFRDQNVCFFPIPKTASTSIKSMLFPDEKDPEILHKKNMAVDFLTLTKADHDKFETWQKIALIRDPIERAISCYRQKILTSGHLGRLFREKGNPHNLSEKPDFNEYIKRLNLYNSTSSMLRHHVRSTIFFLGKDSNYFTKIYKMSEIKLLENHLQQVLNISCSINNKNNTSTNSDKIYIKREIFDKLKSIFKEDYELYNFDEFNKDNYLNLQME
jgi:hypothetical protein